MGKSKAEIRARESRWAVPAGIASILGVVLLTASRAVEVGGDGQADILRSADADSGGVLLAGLIQTLGFLLLAVPLLYLFRAVQARSDRVRSQLIGLVVAAPLFLAISSGLSIGVTSEAADSFIAGDAEPTLTAKEAREECVDERQDEGNDFLRDEYDPAKGEAPLRACENRKLEDDAAVSAVEETSLAPLATGLSLAGVLGFIAALFYTGLWAMRTGLLSRFWGSLGMVAGIAFVLGPLSVVTLAWFLYFGFLAWGAVPGGRPPAWEAAEAIPWPTPGERAAAEMEPDEELEEPEGAEGAETADKRKRKRRE
jgi:hypothetical protein